MGCRCGTRDGNTRRGGGAYAARNNITVTPNQSYSVTVGLGGGIANPGVTGGDSFFGNGSQVLEKGGIGGSDNAGAGGSATNSIGAVIWAGGTGGNRGGNVGGGGGGSATATGAGGAGALGVNPTGAPAVSVKAMAEKAVIAGRRPRTDLCRAVAAEAVVIIMILPRKAAAGESMGVLS